MSPEDFETIFRGDPGLGGPHTLTSPIRYEVWRDYALAPTSPVDLLLEMETSANVVQTLRELVGADPAVEHHDPQVAGSGGIVALDVPFETFLRVLVPTTDWRILSKIGASLTREQLGEQLASARAESAADRIQLPTDVLAAVPPPARRPRDLAAKFQWFSLLVTRIGYEARRKRPNYQRFSTGANGNAVKWLKGIYDDTEMRAAAVLPEARSISRNRLATVAVRASRGTVKADAAARVFDIDASKIGWAVLDSGIDATHPAFRRFGHDGEPFDEPFVKQVRGNRKFWVNQTRVVRTYDFIDARRYFSELSHAEYDAGLRGVKMAMDDHYLPPRHEHGTHVAGILGADWPGSSGGALTGVCPSVRLFDFRVLNDTGRGTEFDVITGLRAVRWINETAGRMVIHGVNLSLSIAHHVANYACGFTPVCRAAEDLVASGVVVVAAAGNAGFIDPNRTRLSAGTGYNTVSITDPGNAENIITVGATHGLMPYRHGTSYFSSRGPTADGRPKPDLLAPGEGIYGPVPDADEKTYDGTSQAAPHVSGVAALLLGRYPELRGDPMRVKRILCETANDVGRDRYFQGHGLVDALRALQSI